MSLPHLSTIVTSLSTWSVTICVSTFATFNVICHHTCLSHISSLVTSSSAWSACHHMCLLHLLILTNLICHYIWLSRISTLATFLSTSSVIIFVYPTYISLPPSYHFDLSLYMAIPHIYPCYLFFNMICHHYVSISHLYPWHFLMNLICHHICLSHIYTLVTFLSTWRVIILCLSHISTLFTSLSNWSVIIYGYPHLHLCHLLINLSLPYIIDLVSYLFVSSLFIHNTI